MSGRKIHNPHKDDGLDYSAANLFQRMCNLPATNPRMSFGTQFDANERFWEESIAHMNQQQAAAAEDAAERKARKEDRECLRQGRRTLADLRRHLAQR